jgi:hypothetical protein
MQTIRELAEFKLLAEVCDGLVPVWMGAIEAGVSRQRMDALIAEERLPAFRYHAQVWVSLGACEVWKRREHFCGRPEKGCELATITFEDIEAFSIGIGRNYPSDK